MIESLKGLTPKGERKMKLKNLVNAYGSFQTFDVRVVGDVKGEWKSIHQGSIDLENTICDLDVEVIDVCEKNINVYVKDYMSKGEKK